MPTLRIGRSLTNDGLFTYTWNVAGQLVGVENVTVTIVYTYNGDGVRVAESTNGIERLYVQDVVSFGLPQVLVETTQQPNHQTTYLYGLGRLAQVNEDSWEWFLGDALGSVRQLADDAGEVVLAQAYDPYGQVMSSSGTSSSGYGYTGEQDANAGLVFLRARYVAPALGRFLSEDIWPGSIQQPSSLHKYAYVSANPVLFVDPSGHCGESGLGGVCFDPDDGGGGGLDELFYFDFDFRFTASPVSGIDKTYGFGASEAAQGKCDIVCDKNKKDSCDYKSCRGLHNGLDLQVATSGTPVYWTGNMNGKVLAVGYERDDATPNVTIQAGKYDIIFGDLQVNSWEVEDGEIVRPGTQLGKTGAHLHLGIRGKDRGKFYNPLYFFPQEIASSFMATMGPYVEREDPWSMRSYVGATGKCENFFWGESGDKTGIDRPSGWGSTNSSTIHNIPGIGSLQR